MEIAIRATPKPPDASLGRKICDFRFGIYPSPQYLEWAPRLSLAEHDRVNLHEAAERLILLIWDSALKMERSTVFSSPSPTSVLRATEAGMGLMFTSCDMGESNPSLVPVTPPIEC